MIIMTAAKVIQPVQPVGWSYDDSDTCACRAVVDIGASLPVVDIGASLPVVDIYAFLSVISPDPT
jgi:hypothetical protein